LLFNASYNKQVFSPKLLKKIWHRSVLSFSRKTQKPLTPTHSNSEKMTSPSRRLGYSNNQLKVSQLKVQFRKPFDYNGFRKPETDLCFTLLTV